MNEQEQIDRFNRQERDIARLKAQWPESAFKRTVETDSGDVHLFYVRQAKSPLINNDNNYYKNDQLNHIVRIFACYPPERPKWNEVLVTDSKAADEYIQGYSKERAQALCEENGPNTPSPSTTY